MIIDVEEGVLFVGTLNHTKEMSLLAKTVPEAFRQFKSNLEITDLQASTVAQRQINVRNVVSSGLSVLDSFLTGSYIRSTMIAPLKEADVDIFLVLDSKYFHNYNNQNGGQGGLLDLLKRTLLKTYTRTPDISRDGQAVTIRFDDFVVDVVPGFNRQGGGFLIPNSISQTWISTNPKTHVDIWANANRAHNQDFIPLVKMIKGWNRTIGRHFESFHLETMALSILTNVTISDFPSGTRFFFDKARELVKTLNPDPAGYGGDVGAYINTQDKIREAASKFEVAYDRAIKAEGHAASGRFVDAIETWGKIFGDYFPCYG